MWDTIVEVDLEGGSPFRAVGDSGDEYIGDVLVIATGAQAKWLGVPGEQELGGKVGARRKHVHPADVAALVQGAVFDPLVANAAPETERGKVGHDPVAGRVISLLILRCRGFAVV